MIDSGSRLPFGLPRDLAVVALSMLIWGLGEGLFIFFYPLALRSWNADTVQIGTVLSMIGVTMALVQVPAGYLSDRFGPRPVVLAALLLGVGAALLMAVANSLGLFVAGLIAYGMTSFVVAPINSYVTSIRGSWSVQRAVTFNGGAFQMGAIFGPLLGGWIGEQAGFSTVFASSALLFLMAVLIFGLTRRPPAVEAVETGLRAANPLANPRFFGLLALVFLTIIALSTPQQLASLYLQEVHNLSLQQIGLTGTLAGIGTAAAMFALGSLRPLQGLFAGQLLVGLFALFLWRGQSAAAFYVGYLFVGGYRLYRAMTLAFARPLVQDRDVGLAYGLMETTNALAVILAPLAAGFLYRLAPTTVFSASLAALALTVLLHGLLAGVQKLRDR